MDSYALIPCPSCGAINRVRSDRIDSGPKCAKCKTKLDPTKPQDLTAGNFDKVVNGSTVPVLVEFYSNGCGACRSMEPVVNELARQNPGGLIVAKVNSDREPVLHFRFQVMGVPTFVLMKGGREIDRQVGAVPPNNLLAMLNKAA